MNVEYLDYTKSDVPKYKKLIKKLDYYIINQADLNKRIDGNYTKRWD